MRGPPRVFELELATCGGTASRCETEIGTRLWNLVDRSSPMDSLTPKRDSAICTVIYYVNYFSAEGDLLLELGFL